MKITANFNQPAFQAHFLNSKSLEMITDYAIQKGKIDKLAIAKRNIESCYNDVYLRVDIFKSKNFPCITFSRFTPKKRIKNPESMNDFVLTNTKMYKSLKPCNLLKYALHKVIRLGYDVPNYPLFQDVVINKTGKKKK